MSFNAVLVALLAALMASAAHAGRWELRGLPLADGGKLRYAIALPNDFDPEQTYPALLALPPGDQSESMVRTAMARYWGVEGARRGWIVICPIAPEGEPFYRGSEGAIPPLLDAISKQYKIEHGVFHLGGNSAGGLSAFKLAVLHPDRFASMTVLPGCPPDEETDGQLDVIAHLPIAMLVGGEDTRWVEAMEGTQRELAELGADVSLTVFPGEGHVPWSMDGGAAMECVAKLREKVNAVGETTRAVAAVLDDFHAAAAEADGERYFAHFAPRAVFLGTDPTERWTIGQFRAFADPYFSQGKGWTYTTTSRSVTISADGDTAWFGEALSNESYGECRGTGVLVKLDGQWRIAQYSLSIPIPNDLARDIVEMIRDQGDGEDPTEP